jgi:hypothetical protein
MDKRVLIAGIVAGLAEYYDKTLSPSQLAMYSDDLSELEPQALALAVKRYRTDPKNDRFPLPARLKSMVQVQFDPDSEAAEAVSRIMAAIGRIGPYRESDARAAVGELGWAVVTQEGGWAHVCTLVTNENIGTLRAQWKTLAKVKYERARAGLTEAPSLPDAQDNVAQIRGLLRLPEMPK